MKCTSYANVQVSVTLINADVYLLYRVCKKKRYP